MEERKVSGLISLSITSFWTYPLEFLGENNIKESLMRVIKSSDILAQDFGRIYIEFAGITETPLLIRWIYESYVIVFCTF